MADQNLILIGGGPKPPQALKNFVELAGGQQATFLVITWGSSVPQEASSAIIEDLRAFGEFRFTISLRPPKNKEEVNKLLKNLNDCTGIFFSGGDQNRLMKGMHELNLVKAFKQQYRQGKVFSGTSAGTAIMSHWMMTGEEPATAMGLGLLDNLILDQHFFVRNRRARLWQALQERSVPLGLGIDEGAALQIRNGEKIRVLGSQKVLFLEKDSAGQPKEKILGESDSWISIYSIKSNSQKPVVAVPQNEIM